MDVGDDGRNKHDFFRIRVDLSVKQPLKDKLTIKISAKVEWKQEVLHFDMKECHTSVSYVASWGMLIRTAIREVQMWRIPFAFQLI